MNTKLKEFFDIDIIDVCIREGFAKDFDILLEISGGEAIRFFVYPETENFRLYWYGSSLSSLEAYDSVKVLYLQSVAKIATTLNNKDNLKKLIDILKGK